jgi:ubiquinone/menaquinone biosynthesis C-methylase UbiE
MTDFKSTAFNIKAHNKIYNKYEKRHPEIFNAIEQQRLETNLGVAKSFIKTNSVTNLALDYGSGSGNLTQHLLNFGFKVIASDVAEKFLLLIKKRFSNNRMLETIQVNGTNLDAFQSDKFDFVATYSVLHHIVDYLKIVEDMIRVCKPGGVIYIDHELSEDYWSNNKSYIEFREKVEPQIDRSWKKYFLMRNYVYKFKYMINKIRTNGNPRFISEGDIHVWSDDHIEWDQIKSLLLKNNCEIINFQNYLLYRGFYPVEIYNQYKDNINDCSFIIATKK